MTNDLPELSKEEVEKVVELYKEIFQPAVRIVSATVRPSPKAGSYFVTSQWSQRSLERGSSIQIMRTLLTDSSFSCVEVNAVDVSHWVLHARSNSGKLKAVVHTTTSDDPKIKTKYFLEVWTDEKLLQSFDLGALNLHGPVYTDEMFGTFSWSKDDNKIVYIAEKKQPKTAPFYQQKAKKDAKEDTQTDTKDDQSEERVGEQYLYEDDWGEQMSPKTHPVIAVCDVIEKNINILKGVPDDISPGQIVWEPSGDGVIGLGVYHRPRRLGIIFCTNRRSCIFHLSSNEQFNILSDENMSVFSPTFSPDGKYLVWLQRSMGGPHHTACELVKCDWSTKRVTVVVDVVKTATSTKNGKLFFGIYSTKLPQNCWSSDSKYVFLSSSQNFCVKSYAVNIDDGSVWDLSSSCEESISILDVSADDFILCSKSSFSLPPVLVAAHFPAIEKSSFDVTWNCLTKPSPIADGNIISKFTVVDKSTKEEHGYAIYFGPENKENQSVPVILYPHGGPHACSAIAFSPVWQLFSRLGVAVLIVNYRGSTGCGKNFLDALLGHVGSMDVKDCYVALQNSFDRFPWLDPKNVLLFGGSHGGFLVTHLSSQYPEDFKGVVAVNPVVNLTAMAYITDIPDWTSVEVGYSYDGISTMMDNPDVWNALWSASPMRNVKKVKAPTLLLLGKKDLRVPASPALSYYQALKEVNVPTKVFYYDDNHALGTIPAEMDSVINAVLWFKRCMKRIH